MQRPLMPHDVCYALAVSFPEERESTIRYCVVKTRQDGTQYPMTRMSYRLCGTTTYADALRLRAWHVSLMPDSTYTIVCL